MKLARHVTVLLGALTDADVQDMSGAERIGLRQEAERVLRMLSRVSAVPARPAPKSGVLAQLHEGARPE